MVAAPRSDRPRRAVARHGILQIGLGLLSLLCPATARAAVPAFGDLLTVSPTAMVGEQPGAVLAVDLDMGLVRIVSYVSGLDQVDAVTAGERKLVYVANGDRILVIDPYLGPTATPQVLQHPYFSRITDLQADGRGGLYVLDARADPLGNGGQGAVMRLRLSDGAVELITADFRFGGPWDFFLEDAGTLLIVDPWGKTVAGGERVGALYRVDPEARTMDTVASLEFAAHPTAVVALSPDTLLIADPQATIPGFKDQAGAVFKLGVPGAALLDTLAIDAFREPRSLIIDERGVLSVFDSEANPGEYSGRSGALFQFEPHSGALIGTFHHSIFENLTGLGRMAGADLSSSRFALIDEEEPGLPGERLSLEAVLVNSGESDGADLTCDIELGSLVASLGDASLDSGSLSLDTVTNRLRWHVSLGHPDSARMQIPVQVPWETAHGTWLRVPITVDGAAAFATDVLIQRIVRLLAPGDAIYADPGTGGEAPRLFRFDGETSLPVTVEVDNPELLGRPVDLAFAPGGAIYVLDGTPGNNGVLRVVPGPGDVTVIHRGAPLTQARAICLAHDGSLLIADPKQAPPFRTGLVYRMDPETGDLEEFFVHEQFTDPMDICPDQLGHYLVTDYASTAGGHAGALAEIDGRGNLVRSYATLALRDPFSVVVARDGSVLLTDIGFADAPSPWAVTRIDRSTGNPVFSAIATDSPNPFRRPYGIEALSPTELLICERERNPLYSQSGAIIAMSLSGPIWSYEFVSFNSALRDPERVAIFRPPDVYCVALELEDASGGSLLPGDTLRAFARIDNRSPMADPAAVAQMTYDYPLRFVEARADRGDVAEDPGGGLLQWSGHAGFLDPVQWSAVFVVDELAPFAEEAAITVSIPGSSADPLRATRAVRAPLRGGEVLVVDSQSDPFAGGHRGGLYVFAEEEDLLLPFYSHVVLRAPCDLLALSSRRMILADRDADPYSLGRNTGALFTLNPQSGATQVHSASAAYVDPVRVRAAPDGALLVLDAAAQHCPSGGRGALLRVGSAGGAPQLFACSEAFRALVDMSVDAAGRVWVTDAEADPLGAGGDAGAVFAIDATSGTVVDTIAGPEIRSPAAIECLSDGTLLYSDLTWTGPYGNRGIRRLDTATGRPTTVVTSPYLGTPTRFLPLSDREVLVVDSTGVYPGFPGVRGVIFRLDLLTGQLSLALPSPEDVRLEGLARVPRPELRIARFEAAGDSAGMYFSPEEILECELEIVNPSPGEEPAAVCELRIEPPLRLDPLSAQASAGVLTTTSEGLLWEGPLAGGAGVTLRYDVAAHPAPGLPAWGDQRATVRGAFAEVVERRISHYISSTVGPSELVVVDTWANPRGYGFPTGAVFRIEGSTREAAPLFADSAFTSPAAIARIPGSDTDFLILDADASGGEGQARGALMRASTRTGEVTAIFSDETFVQPRALAVVDSTTCYLLDELADPLDLLPGASGGPGAVYRVDLISGAGEVFFSDTAMSRPVDIDLAPVGGSLYITDSRAAAAGQYAGAIFELSPSGESFRVVHSGSPFMSPRCAALSPAGDLWVADPLPFGGTLFRVDPDGGAQPFIVCHELVSPSDVVVGPRERPFVIDAQSNPLGFTPPTGAVLRFFPDGEYMHCSVYRTGPPFQRPRGATIHFEGATPVAIALEIAATPEGIEIRWVSPGDLAGAQYFVYRRDAQDADGDYACLNRAAPVAGAGELVHVDRTARAGVTYEYLLIGLARDGSRREFGPYEATMGSGSSAFALDRIVPNPLLIRDAAGATIRFRIPTPGGKVRLGLFDVAGRHLRDLVDGPLDPGAHSLAWDTRDAGGVRLPSGCYFFRLQAGYHLAERRFLLLR